MIILNDPPNQAYYVVNPGLWPLTGALLFHEPPSEGVLVLLSGRPVLMAQVEQLLATYPLSEDLTPLPVFLPGASFPLFLGNWSHDLHLSQDFILPGWDPLTASCLPLAAFSGPFPLLLASPEIHVRHRRPLSC